MSLFCPLCNKAVTSEMIKCPWCRHDFIPEAFNLSAVDKLVSQNDVTERRQHRKVVQGSRLAYSSPNDI